jgi:hypothetical protein
MKGLHLEICCCIFSRDEAQEISGYHGGSGHCIANLKSLFRFFNRNNETQFCACRNTNHIKVFFGSPWSWYSRGRYKYL